METQRNHTSIALRILIYYKIEKKQLVTAAAQNRMTATAPVLLSFLQIFTATVIVWPLIRSMATHIAILMLIHLFGSRYIFLSAIVRYFEFYVNPDVHIRVPSCEIVILIIL